MVEYLIDHAVVVLGLLTAVIAGLALIHLSMVRRGTRLRHLRLVLTYFILFGLAGIVAFCAGQFISVEIGVIAGQASVGLALAVCIMIHAGIRHGSRVATLGQLIQRIYVPSTTD